MSRFKWLEHAGLTPAEIERLLPTVPGGFTSANSFYVNSLIPEVIFRGQEQSSIPMTPGRWFAIPLEIVDRHPTLRSGPRSLAAAVSLLRDEEPRSFVEWTSGG
jgi:hypothetical protein